MATIATATQQAVRHVRDASPWHAVIRAMGQTGGASVLSGLFTMAATKIIAVVLGPAYVALLATLQQLRNSAVTMATVNGQTALVQGTSSTTGRVRREFLRTSLVVMGLASLLTAGILIALPGWTAELAGLEADHTGLIRWLAVPVLLSGAYVFLAAMLNALGAIATLAKLQLAAPAATLLLAYPVAMRMAPGQEGLLIVMLSGSSAAATFAASLALYRRRADLREWFAGQAVWWSRGCAKRFFSISGSMLASGLIASGALLLLRGNILRTDGLVAGGQFDAAWAISMNHVTLMLASMQTYYLPVLARTTDPLERQGHIARVLAIAGIGAAILIAVLAAFKPLVISMLYADSFAHAAQYLRWTLIGDYLKVTSWILSIPLIAMADMRTFLFADLAAYLTFLASGFALARLVPAAEAVAIAFVLMYAVHMIVCATCLWRCGEFRPDRRSTAVWTAGLALVAGSSAWNWDVTGSLVRP